MNIFKVKSNTIQYYPNVMSDSNYLYSLSNSGAIAINAPHGLYNGSVCILGVIHCLHLYYRNVKTSTINLINRTIEAILPNKYRKLEKSQLLKILVEKLYDKIAEQEIERAMEKTRLLLGFAPEDYSIQRLENGQIAECYTDEKKIIINPDIAKYDRKVIEYIVLHEFCHLKYKNHCRGFWQMIKKYMPDYQKYIK